MKTQKASKSKTTPTPDDATKIEVDTTESDPVFEKMVKWLEGRTLAEKMTAVMIIALTTAEYKMPDTNIGNKFLNQWEEELFTKPQDGELGFLAGFAYAVGLIGA